MLRILLSSLLVLIFAGLANAQENITDCKAPYGNPPCHSSNTTFNGGRNTGCKVDFHFTHCDGYTHGSVYDSCTNGTTCHDNCSCSCSSNGYGLSYENCNGVIISKIYTCPGCVRPTPTPTPTPTPDPTDCGTDPCCADPYCCGDPCCGDPCCGDPCCGDPCCGDPCCGDPTCGQQCYQVCAQDCVDCCTVYDDYGDCYYWESCCGEPVCDVQCY
jgi:hypothetical protein